MNEHFEDPGTDSCFLRTKFVHWNPGEYVKLQVLSPPQMAWVAQILIWGLVFGLSGGFVVHACFQTFVGVDSISYLEAVLIAGVPMATLGAIHLAGTDIARSLEIDWETRQLSSCTRAKKKVYRMDDLKMLVLRGSYFERYHFRDLSEGMITRTEKNYRAQLHAAIENRETCENEEVLILDTDSKQLHVEMALEELAPYAVELAKKLGVGLQTEASTKERYGFFVALARAPKWLHVLLAMQFLFSASWITWHAQPAFRGHELQNAIVECGGTISERGDWEIEGTQYGPLAVYSFEDHPLTDTEFLELGELLLASERFELNLSGTRITDVGLKAIAGNAQLIAINLYGTSVTDRGAATIGSCCSLVAINLSKTRVTRAALDDIKHLKNLKSLWIAGEHITNLQEQVH